MHPCPDERRGELLFLGPKSSPQLPNSNAASCMNDDAAAATKTEQNEQTPASHVEMQNSKKQATAPLQVALVSTCFTATQSLKNMDS